MIAARKRAGFWFLLLACLPHLLDAQTTVTLSTSPNPSIFGAPVTLTATVTPPNATGRVTFYDGLTVLGTKPLFFHTASISTIALPAGVRNLRAYYAGDSSNFPATSNVIAQTVNAQPSSNLARSPFPIAATRLLAVDDFNGDGKADIATTAFNDSLTLVLLQGDGAGNLHTGFTRTFPDFIGYLTVGDFNGDGIPDLAITTLRQTANLNILLGNGDGTFQTARTFPLPGIPFSQVSGDFNGDGKLDLLVVSPNTGVTVLLGQGDGTFQTGNSYLPNPQAGQGSQGTYLLVADFNGDGKADFAVLAGGSKLFIYMGAGDGTFLPPVATASPLFNAPLASGDFNGDGKADLATSDGSVLLGNGDGTFQRPVNYANGLAFPLLGSAYAIALADVNGDGIVDIALGDTSFNAGIDILLGNGDGTFRPGAAHSTVPGLLGLLAGEFNGDGKTDFAALSGNTVEIVFGTNVTMTATRGTPQSTPVNTPFPLPLEVTVKDGSTPLGGVPVQFITSGFQTSATLSSNIAITDANGVASVMATANGVAGGPYTVTAASGVSAQFVLTNLGAPPSRITASPATQSTQVGTSFPQLLHVTLTDPNGFGLAATGITVTFTAPSSGASAVLSSTTAVTDATGTASVMATANNIAGSYTVTATAAGLSVPFAMTNRPAITTAATVTLATSPNPSTLGGPVTLTATVVSPNANGRVTFFDGTSPLGTRTVSANVAALSTILLSSGVHKLTAYYRDETNLVAGTSNAVTQTVKAAAGGAFIVTSTQLNSTPSGSPVALGDFNSDGLMDFAYLAFGNIFTATSKGNGAFTQAFYASGLQGVTSLVAADFDGDGLTDLAAATPTGTVSVLMGVSAGGFSSTVVRYPATSGAAPVGSTGALAVGDFNGDGKPDLVYAYVANGPLAPGVPTYVIGVTILPGAGNGAFGSPIPYASVQLSPAFPVIVDLKVADFNGDGTPDLAILARNGNVSIVLGNRDGTAQPQMSIGQTGLKVLYSAVVGDFNGDGTADLALGGIDARNTANTVILLGRGDGTFQSGAIYPFGAAAAQGDFNGDGITDLVVTDSLGNMQGLLLGRGDGTFQQGLILAAGGPLAVADFNSDGRADILANDGTVLLGAGGAGPPASIAATGGTPQSALLGMPFLNPLQATVKDANGLPVAGVTVTFILPVAGPSAILSSTTAVTNASGVASVTATANNIAGNYIVVASVGSVSTSFLLTNAIGASNLSAGKPATQSSTYPGSPGAGAAVDNNTDGNFYHGSVTATNLDIGAWWQVDLGISAAVSSVAVWNRTDCCGPRLGDYWVFVSNTPFLATDTTATLQGRAGTFASHQLSAPNPSTTITFNAPGRYVRVQLPDAGYLSLAEVQVTGTAPQLTNLAQGKVAMQSSTYPGYATDGAGAAVDGTTDGNFFDGSVTATNLDSNAWWQVDLGTSATVSSVVVWNRTDCCGTRLNDYWVFVSDTPFGAGDTPAMLQGRAGTFSSHQIGVPNPTTVIAVGAQGRYVRVQLTGAGYLSLAEVQVVGQ
jgi:hypothetical protein